MKLPHLLKDEHSAHFILFLLAAVNLLLIVLLFFILYPQTKALLPKIIPISSQIPTVNFNLVYPQPNSTVSGTVPLITTLANGPKITSAQLTVDGQKVQAITSQKTEKLTIFWDTTQVADGSHAIIIKVGQDNNRTSTLTTALNVQNNVERSVSQR